MDTGIWELTVIFPVKLPQEVKQDLSSTEHGIAAVTIEAPG